MFPWSGKRCLSHQQIYLKRTWPIHQFLRPIFRFLMWFFSCFPVNSAKVLRSVFFIEHLWWPFLQMLCFTLYFQKEITKYIVVIHCIIVSFWNLKSLLLSFAFIHCPTRCHLLYHSVTHCHSLSLICSRCHSLYYSLSLVVIRCHSVYHASVFYKLSFEHILYVKVSKISSYLTRFLNHSSLSFQL